MNIRTKYPKVKQHSSEFREGYRKYLTESTESTEGSTYRKILLYLRELRVLRERYRKYLSENTEAATIKTRQILDQGGNGHTMSRMIGIIHFCFAIISVRMIFNFFLVHPFRK